MIIKAVAYLVETEAPNARPERIPNNMPYDFPFEIGTFSDR